MHRITRKPLIHFKTNSNSKPSKIALLFIVRRNQKNKRIAKVMMMKLMKIYLLFSRLLLFSFLEKKIEMVVCKHTFLLQSIQI